MYKLSEKAWHISERVVEAIKAHPFNAELAEGSLAMDTFAYYIEQDSLYLQDFGRAHAMIASRAPLQYVRDFLAFSDYSFIAEQEVVHHFFRVTFSFQATGFITPTTLSYTSYLLQLCATQAIEVAIAALLPCFWVYREVGLSIVNQASIENPYRRWIDTYAGEAFGQSVEKTIHIFDDVASKATEEIRSKMVDAFYKSTVFEWHFWNDAYHKTTFDHFLT